jgi:hypothetical protein
MAQELGKNETCPCGSNKRYGRCCKRQKIRFERNDDGEIFQVIPIHPELETHLLHLKGEFRRIFGRRQGKDDPVLASQYLHDADEYWDHVIRIGKSAHIPEELLFASRRTDFFLAERNLHLVPEVRKQEWREAIDEYFSLGAKGYDPFYVFSPLTPRQYDLYKSLVELLDAIIIVSSAAIDDIKRVRNNASFFQFYFISRALCSMRTIREMFHSRYDDDCLSILRGIYECYLRIKFLRLKPDNSIRFIALALRDLGEAPVLKRKNGKIDRQRVLYDGKIVDVRISNSWIVRESKFKYEELIYYRIYPELSGFVHPDVVHVLSHANEYGGIGLYRKNNPHRSIVFVVFVALLLLEEMSRCQFLYRKRTNDLTRCKLRVARQLNKYIGYKNEFVKDFTALARMLPAVMHTHRAAF